MRPLANDNLTPSQCAVRRGGGGSQRAHGPQKQQQSGVVQRGNTGKKSTETAPNARPLGRKSQPPPPPPTHPALKAADGMVQEREGLTCSLQAGGAGWRQEAGAVVRGGSRAEECAGGGRELGPGSDQDPDQGGGAQLCQELFTLTEHAAAHLFTPPTSPPPSPLTQPLARWRLRERALADHRSKVFHVVFR